MTFSEVFIRKPIMTTLVMIAILAFGAGAYFTLPISDLPNVDYPVMTISVSYPGASPATMASAVASPLENECMQIPGLQSVISDNTDGSTTITLTFDLNRNVDLAAPDVQAAISRAQPNLPSDLPNPPSYSKNNPSDSPVMYIMVLSETMDQGELYDYANRTIGQRMSMIDGVSQVQVYGSKTAIRVKLNPWKMAAFDLGIDEVAAAIDSGTVTIPGGSLNGRYKTFSIEPNGQLLKAGDYDELIIAYRKGRPVRLKDVGTCIDSIDNDYVSFMYGSDGGPMTSGSSCIAISRQGGANTVALSKAVKQTLADIQNELPGSVRTEIFYDKADTIVESVNDVKSTIVIALVLVVLVIFVFLGRVSDTVIPSMALPFSILGTFIAMSAAGFSLDNLSLMAITLSVGFLVDDAIVVLENSVRHVEEGLSPLSASIKSSGEITFTVISTSVALITVFLPLVFMSGVVGRNFREFSLVVVFAIACSTLISLTLTPMMCGRVLKPAAEKKNMLQRFTDTFEGGMRRKYALMLSGLLDHKYIAVILWVACIAGTFMFFSILPKTFMPEGDSGVIAGQLMMQQGASTEEMREFQEHVNTIIMANTNVSRSFTGTGLDKGADQSTGPFIVVLNPAKTRPTIRTVLGELEGGLMRLPYGFAFAAPIPSLKISSGGESTASGRQYSYVLSGSDKDELYSAAEAVEAKMQSMTEYFSGVESSIKLNMPQLDLEIDRDRASSLGITAQSIEYALSLCYGGGRITTYKTDVDQYDVIMQLEDSRRRNPADLSTIYLRSVNNDLVPMQSLAEWNETVGAQSVPHHNQLNSGTISFNLKDNVPLGNATKALNDAVASILPASVTGEFEGEAQEFEEAVKSLAILLFVAVFVMYVILGILYESYIHPFTILTTLPVAAFGGLATLYLFNSELSLYAYIGMFMLLGIVSKNGIMMVDFAKQGMLEEGLSPKDAIHNACVIRFRPILMTGMSTIMGAAPIALGYGADGASRRPLGLIIMGGLVFAQVVTLFVTPGIFLYMQTIQDKFLNRFELLRSGEARQHERNA